MKGTWETASGGDGAAGIVAALVACVVACAAAMAVAKAVASIPIYVWILATAAMVTGIAVFVRLMVRSNRAQAAAFAARRAEIAAAGEAEAVARRQHRLEERAHQLALAAASAPRVHTHVWPSAEAAIAATHAYAPATVITAAQEIQGRSAR